MWGGTYSQVEMINGHVGLPLFHLEVPYGDDKGILLSSGLFDGFFIVADIILQ